MWDQDGYKRALDFAARAHGKQTVPGGDLPYVVHVTKVAAEVMRACAEERDVDGSLAVTCALLHDTIEDAGVTFAQLEAAFGPAVAAGVDALSKRSALPKAERMRDSLERVRRQPRAVGMVKLADRITNLEPAPAHWSHEKRVAYRHEAEQILEALRGSCAYLEERLREKIAHYEA